MDLKEAIKSRHSVRQFNDMPISEEHVSALNALIEECNEESGLRMQLITGDPECFDSFLAHYGNFRNANNYIAIVGPKSLPDLEEKGGYYGERVVLAADRKSVV